MLDWTDPRRKGDNFYFTFKDQNLSKASSLQSAHQTIKYIVEHYPPPYTLYVSGGVDSQAMLYSWLTSGVTFNTFSATYNETLNDYDLETLDTFSKQHNIKINYHNFDLISFLENEHETYANEYRCGSPQITTFMKLADMTTEGTVIFSGQFIAKSVNQGMYGIPNRNNFSLYYYGLKAKKNIVPFFFIETPELAYSIDMTNPDFFIDDVPGGYPNKVRAYQYYGYPVVSQKTKFNGFEKLKVMYDTNPPRQPTIEDRLDRVRNQISNRNFDLLYRNKFESKFFKYQFIIVR